MNTNQQTVTCEHIRSLTISIGLLDRLLPRCRGNRYTRIEAYRYLLSRLTDQHLGKQTLLGVELDIKPGQVIITDSELSQTWGWHRATVKSFLCELEELSVLTMCREKKFSVLTFPAVQEKVAACALSTVSSSAQRSARHDAIASDETLEKVSASDHKKSKPTTTVRNSRSNPLNISDTPANIPHVQAPSLFDDADCILDSDVTLDKTESSKADNAASDSSSESMSQAANSIAGETPSFPLALMSQNSSVSDGHLLTHTDERKTTGKPIGEIHSADHQIPNNDASNEA